MTLIDMNKAAKIAIGPVITQKSDEEHIHELCRRHGCSRVLALVASYWEERLRGIGCSVGTGYTLARGVVEQLKRLDDR